MKRLVCLQEDYSIGRQVGEKIYFKKETLSQQYDSGFDILYLVLRHVVFEP